MKVNSISTLQTKLGRWIIVLPSARSWAWSGSRFVEHYDGISREAQVCNFDTEQEALDYATAHVIAKTQNEENDQVKVRKLLQAACHALRSYQYDNAAPDLAKECADKIDQYLNPPAVPPEAFEYVEAISRAAEELTGAPARVAPGEKGRVTVGFSSYNARRYSKPWIARVTAWPVGGKPEIEFGRYLGNPSGGEVEIMAAPGDIIRWGQKDGRNNNGTRAYWGVVEADLSVRDTTEAQARKLFQKEDNSVS